MIETKAVYADRANQSLKHINSRFIEGHGGDSFLFYLNWYQQRIVAIIDLMENPLDMLRFLLSFVQ